MTEVGGYELHLYCDQLKCPILSEKVRDLARVIIRVNDEYAGRNRSECVAQARSDGWIFHRDGRHSCPRCRGKRAK